MACSFVSVGNAIAKEIRSARDASTFLVNEFEAACLWSEREHDLQTLDELRVDVAPLGYVDRLKTRGSWSQICSYQVGVRKRFSSEHRTRKGREFDAEVTFLIDLTSSVLRYFMPVRPDHQGRRLADVAVASWVEPKEGQTRVWIDWDSLRDLGQFSAWFPLTYEVAEASA